MELPALNDQKIVVLGAGMVGVCSALELQRRGAKVTLVDRCSPGTMTSYGNAGVLARSSLIPINNPRLVSSLPRLVRNTSPALRYDARFLVQNAPWLLQFFASIRPKTFYETVAALDGLIRISIDEHLKLFKECGLQSHLRNHGWLLLYRNLREFDKAEPNQKIMARYGIAMEELGPADLTDIEPDLAPIFEKATWIKDAYSVDNPGAVVEGYAKAFANAGGLIEMQNVKGYREGDEGITVELEGHGQLSADKLVVALGPWAKQFLRTAGYHVGMAFERGYHRHFLGGQRNGANTRLNRPIYDTAGGYVLAPMETGFRLSTGVELVDDEAPQTRHQIDQVEHAAREAIALGERKEDQPWMGRRPSFPDSRPAIGLAPESKRVYLGIGHQHIGFTTGAGTAKVLADLMSNVPCDIDPKPFRTDRYVKRIS